MVKHDEVVPRGRVSHISDGRQHMAVRLGVLALLEAKAGKGDELGAFLMGGRALAVAEEDTVTWYWTRCPPERGDPEGSGSGRR